MALEALEILSRERDRRVVSYAFDLLVLETDLEGTSGNYFSALG